MKRLFFNIVLLISLTSNIQSQKINNSNYYDYQIKFCNTNWLRPCDAVPVIIDELLKNDIEYYTIGVGSLVKLNDSTRVVMTVSFLINHKTYGFIYQDTHYGKLEASHRDFMKDTNNCSYMQFEKYNDTGDKYMEVKPLPKNTFLLRETCYWYQTNSDGSNAPVTKEIAIAILRQDIRNYLKKI
jgi:hypothetical protein